MSESKRRIVIIGASAAGLRCACRLARLDPGFKVTVVEAREVFSYGACGMPYVLAGEIGDATALRKTVYGAVRDEAYFADTKGVEVLGGQRAVGVDAEARTVTLEGPDGERELHWDELVLATGASPRRLPGQPDHERVLSFHVHEDIKPLHEGLVEGRIGHVAIVGAGLVGCELAEAFGGLWGAEVTLIEAEEAPLPGVLDGELALCVQRHLEAQGTRVMTGAPVESIIPDADGVTLQTAGGEVRADAVVVAIGVVPAVELARSLGVKLGPTGAIAVDERQATSVPHVWAAGDCVEVRHAVSGGPAYLPLGSLANRQGRVLGDVLAGRETNFPPVAGAVAVKVFDWNVAAVGLTAIRARALGLDVATAWASADDRAHYWPDSKEIDLALVYERPTHRLLGVQAAGEGEVAKRIDVATQLVARGARLEDLADVEHAYAPPYAPAVEPLSVLAQVALNQEEGVRSDPTLESLTELDVLDVRIDDERERWAPGGKRVLEIPLHELRKRLSEVDGEPSWLVICERGTRSAEAVRVLAHEGLKARYLGGGLRWRKQALKSGDAS